MSKKGDARRKRRAERKAKRKEARAKKKQAREDKKIARKLARRKAKADRIQQRQDGRSGRLNDRQNTKRDMVEAGLDPNAWITDVSKAGAQITGDIANMMSGGVLPKGMPNVGGNTATVGGSVSAGGDQTTMMIFGAGAIALMLMLKK